LLANQPNPEMTSFTMRKTVQVHRMLWGNGYIELQRDGGNRIIAMWPRNPARMKARRADKNFLINDELVRAGELFYATTEGVESIDPNPESPDRYVNERPIHQLDMCHIPGLSLDGRIGQDVIILARNAIGLALATEKFGGKFFGNGAVGMGVFKFPTLLSPEDREATKRSLQEAWGGENMLRPILLEAGMDYAATSVDPDKAQAIQTREHQVIEICRVLTTPPHMVGVSEKTSRANTEQIGQEFLTFSLNQDLVAWQQEVNRKVLPTPAMGRSSGKKFGMYFDTWPLIVPSANDMRQFFASMIQFGVFEPNDARERLGMNPLSGPASDSTFLPINIAPADKIFENPALPGDSADAGAAEPADGKGKGKDKKKPKGVGGLQQAYSRLFRDAFGRVCVRSQIDLATFQRAFLPVLLSLCESVEQLAAQEFDTDTDPHGLERSSFLAEYVKSMHHRYRSEAWVNANGSSEAICRHELARAVKALTIEIYRDVATRAAKQQSEISEEALP
jgi:HK97 family phage portal protein